MPGSRHFTVDAIRNDLPEKTNEVEVEKWKKISYLLDQEELSTKKLPLRKIRLLDLNVNLEDRSNYLKSLNEGALLIKEYIKAEGILKCYDKHINVVMLKD